MKGFMNERVKIFLKFSWLDNINAFAKKIAKGFNYTFQNVKKGVLFALQYYNITQSFARSLHKIMKHLRTHCVKYVRIRVFSYYYLV